LGGLKKRREKRGYLAKLLKRGVSWPGGLDLIALGAYGEGDCLNWGGATVGKEKAHSDASPDWGLESATVRADVHFFICRTRFEREQRGRTA